MSNFDDPMDPDLLDIIQDASIPADPSPAGLAPEEQIPDPTPVTPADEPVVEDVVQETQPDSGGNPPNASEESPKTVPYERLQTVVGERNTLRTEVEDLKQTRAAFQALMDGDRDTWNTALKAGIIPPEILNQQAAVAPQPQAEQDPWADPQAGPTQAQIDAMISQKLAQQTAPMVSELRQIQHERSQNHLASTYGDAYDPTRDNPIIAAVRLRLPGATLDEAFMLARRDAFANAAPADPTPPPELSRGAVQRPSSEGRTKRTASKRDEMNARLARIEDARGENEVEALTDLLQNL